MQGRGIILTDCFYLPPPPPVGNTLTRRTHRASSFHVALCTLSEAVLVLHIEMKTPPRGP
jgi:hypothetical protein